MRGHKPPKTWGLFMSMLDVSRGVCALLPGLQHWLENAYYTVRIVDAASPRERDDRRILLATEIGHATHRDLYDASITMMCLRFCLE